MNKEQLLNALTKATSGDLNDRELYALINKWFGDKNVYTSSLVEATIYLYNSLPSRNNFDINFVYDILEKLYKEAN